MTRREILALALASPVLSALPGIVSSQGKQSRGFGRQSFIDAPSKVVPVGVVSAKTVKLVRKWKGLLCQSRLVNTGKDSVPVKEVVLFDLVLPLSPETRLYGEGFQMLTQCFCLFNWENAAQKISFRLPRTTLVTDFWSGENLGRHSGEFAVNHGT